MIYYDKDVMREVSKLDNIALKIAFIGIIILLILCN